MHKSYCNSQQLFSVKYLLEEANVTARQDTDIDRSPDWEKFTLFPKTLSVRLENWNKKKLYDKRRLKLKVIAEFLLYS